MPDPHQGRCLCGASTLNASRISRQVGACHCSSCRQWGGGPLLAVDCGSDVTLAGDDIRVYNSSDWAERGFCGQCGSHLFYRLKHNQQYIVPVGLFGEMDDLVLDHQVFIDEKPGYYCFANETKDMTGAEIFEQFAPKE